MYQYCKHESVVYATIYGTGHLVLQWRIVFLGQAQFQLPPFYALMQLRVEDESEPTLLPQYPILPLLAPLVTLSFMCSIYKAKAFCIYIFQNYGMTFLGGPQMFQVNNTLVAGCLIVSIEVLKQRLRLSIALGIVFVKHFYNKSQYYFNYGQTEIKF